MHSTKHLNSKKHFINDELEVDEQDGCVQVIFTNLIKKPRTNDYKEKHLSRASSSVNKFESSSVIVNGKVYNFNLHALIEKEPTNNLLNLHFGEIKKRINESNHIIEYMEQILDFNLVIDYINGYNYKDFGEIFKNNYSRYEHFRMLLSKLGMKNLIFELDSLYPLLNINGTMLTVSTEFINTIESQNNLFACAKCQTNNVFTHFRDREIFNEYFRDYLLGKKTIIEAADYIKRLKQESASNTENYTLAKIKSDLSYYGLEKLKTHVFN